MKGKLLCTLLCLALVLGCFAVPAFAEIQSSENVDWGLTLRPDNIAPTGMVVVVSQSGGNFVGALEYGSSYYLEMRIDDTWVNVPYRDSEVYWTMVAYQVSPESLWRMDLNWDDIYGPLSPGHYRLAKLFQNFSHEPHHNEKALFCAEFVIGESHTCRSEDGDWLCDTCLGIADHDCFDRDEDKVCDLCGQKVSNEDCFRLIGNSDWMRHYSLGSDIGVLKETSPGVYQKTFYNIQPGDYALRVVKNGNPKEAWGDGVHYLGYTLDQQADLTVTFTLDSNNEGVISITKLSDTDQTGEGSRVEENPKTLDSDIGIPALFLLCGTVALLWIFRKRTDIL